MLCKVSVMTLMSHESLECDIQVKVALWPIIMIEINLKFN